MFDTMKKNLKVSNKVKETINKIENNIDLYDSPEKMFEDIMSSIKTEEELRDCAHYLLKMTNFYIREYYKENNQKKNSNMSLLYEQ